MEGVVTEPAGKILVAGAAMDLVMGSSAVVAAGDLVAPGDAVGAAAAGEDVAAMAEAAWSL
jgi:hypothetical protein